MEQYQTENQIPITPKQKDIIRKISDQAQGNDGWLAVEDLSVTKTKTKMVALDKNLRQLELRGIIERRLDNRSREYMKLKRLPAKDKLYHLYEMGD
jgi:hypothetical protein